MEYINPLVKLIYKSHCVPSICFMMKTKIKYLQQIKGMRLGEGLCCH